MTTHDVALLLKRVMRDAVERLATQAEHAAKLDEHGISEALTQVSEALGEVDVDFHLCMLDVYREEEEDENQAL